MSLPRRRESRRHAKQPGVPAFAGVTPGAQELLVHESPFHSKIYLDFSKTPWVKETVN